MQTQTKSARLHYLDWLRVIAILTVFLFHAVHPFDFGVWHIKNVEQSLPLSIVLEVLSWWGMPFFFLVAGTGSWFALRRRTSGEYVVERVKRLLVPYLFGSLVFAPLVYYLEWVEKSQRGLINVSYLAFITPPFSFTPRLLAWGTHLWFLGFLFAFAILSLPFCQWLKSTAGQRLVDWLARFCEKRGGILIFILPLVVVRLVTRPFFLAQDDWSDFLFQMAFFILGFVLYADARFAQAIRRDGWLIVGAAILSFAALVAMFPFGDPFVWSDTPTLPQFYLVNGLVVVNAFGWSVFVMFIGMRFLDFTNRWLEYGQEAVLPFFVVHQPVIIVIAFFVVEWQTGILPKLLTLGVSSFIVSIGLVELVIKRVGVLRMLFGMTTSRGEPRKPVSRPVPTGKVG